MTFDFDTMIARMESVLGQQRDCPLDVPNSKRMPKCIDAIGNI